MANGSVAAHLVLWARRLNIMEVMNNGGDNIMFGGGYYSHVDMEIVNLDQIVDTVVNVYQIFDLVLLEDILHDFFVEEDGLLDEQVTSGTSKTAIEKLKTGRFSGDDKKEDL
ncbi:hypothetical protein FEM48_ZijujUnG0058200 [Ziziphus jujuba var. spinosa]|uniref:Uncharacterized protein n=1 Tax=Ziziphus jujuba var. spinosa TaxID=714518 RepID=A0A978U912_ZIZJJ|nr:hypothetical protein FEM48_ZijujUnG0058200 [Ziziphus jujuba var. spinosa]